MKKQKSLLLKLALCLALPLAATARASDAASLMLQASASEEKRDEKNALFSDGDDIFDAFSGAEKSIVSGGKGIKGFVQFEMAHTTESPSHWSKMMTRGELSGQGDLGNGVKWKLGARLDYDAVFSIDSYYPGNVAHDQRSNIYLRENYLDVSAGDWDYRFGKQQVVWGEMVGLFFADVVSARNMYEFILPEFDMMRIPQWAARAEYFNDDFHAEFLWIPVASYDEIGKPGAEFYPYQIHPAGMNVVYRSEDRPVRNLANANYGIRLSTLTNGWDISGFVYDSRDVSPTFYRDTTSVPGTYIYQARHDRIQQYGGTLTKDFGDVVLKGEMVYTHGRQFSVIDPADRNGVVPQNTLDWALGLDFSLPAETRFNFQLFQRKYYSYDSNLIADEWENGLSLLLNRKFGDKLEAQALWITSLNRTDWLFRPKLLWNFEQNWRLAVGADVFKGPQLGLFGRYDQQDRVYSEIRYSF